MKERLFESLKNYSDTDFYPFHMPGHKRNPESGPLAELYRYDITEIDGFDNLHQPETLIRDAQERAAKLYHSEETYFLINGSTAGILSAVSAIAGRGEKLIIARNCHKAVYHAAFLNRMELYYVYPRMIEEYGIAGAVTAEDLEDVIKTILDEEKAAEGNKEVKKAQELIAGVVITSPTYDGIVSDIKKISSLVHSFGLPLIVDQAHGAHFGLHPAYPESAVDEGADIVIHSVHKTLPAPTQTALLHRNGNLTDGCLLRKYLRIYQSSSPSYLLMSGIDEAVFIAKREGRKRLEALLGLRNKFLTEMRKCRFIQVCPVTEPGKLVIAVKDFPMTGQMLYDVLREKYHLQMEMAAGNYVVGILSMMDTEEGFKRLLDALKEIDGNMLSDKERKGAARKKDSGIFESRYPSSPYLHPRAKLSIWKAYMASNIESELDQAAGETAAEFINLYPPGIPIVVPGEVLDEQIIGVITDYLKGGYTVQGVCENRIKVVIPSK